MMTAAGLLPLTGPGAGPEARRRWPRRALVVLWLLVFAGAGAALARSWDRIVDNLTSRPAPTTVPAAAPPAGGGGARP